MKIKYLLIYVIISSIIFPQSFTILSWNIQDLGKSKNIQEINLIIDIIKDYDIVLIQEVNAKDFTMEGAQTVAKIAGKLNKKASKWDYRVSNPAHSRSSYYNEKFAFLWNSSKIKLVIEPYLDIELPKIIYKEPFIAKFQIKESKHSFFVINVHSVMSKDKYKFEKIKLEDSSYKTVRKKYQDNPEKEIKHFIKYPEQIKSANIIIAGDFNLNEDNKVWIPLKKLGFIPAINKSPTLLNKECSQNGQYLNTNIDNIYYNSNIYNKINSGRIDFVGDCSNLEKSRRVSDHLPVFIELNIFNRN